jgi:sugar lactone lactonase YvrE
MKNNYLKKLLVISLFVIGLLLVACAKRPTTPIAGKLVYSGAFPDYVFKKGTNITPVIASGIKPDDATVEYLIKPKLPLGLKLNSTKGDISGTPTEAIEKEEEYTITATGTGDFIGVITNTIKITIEKSPITGKLIYSGAFPNYVFKKGTNITPLIASGIIPDNATVKYSINPINLPPGLNFNPTNGTISGTPTEVKPEIRYTITVIGTGDFTGVITKIIKITTTTKTLITGGLVYSGNPPYIFPIKTIINDLTSSGIMPVNATVKYSIKPTNLPLGLNFNPINGTISGTPTKLNPETSYTITAIATGGFTGVITKIIKIKIDVSVTTLAGSIMGFANGKGTAAKFNYPFGIAVDSSGNIFVTDRENHKIRKITSQGEVSTLAGSTLGFADGKGTVAKFHFPEGIALDSSGNIFVTDRDNYKIRKITSQGEVSTLAGSIRGFADTKGAAAKFYWPSGIVVDNKGNILVTDTINHKIRKITSQGEVSTFAGSTMGFADGHGTAAQFNYPYGIALDNKGNILVTDRNNDKIRKITSQGEVSTLAGSTEGFADGHGAAAKFYWPYGIVVDTNGNILVADTHNHKIRKITSQGEVSTLAGSSAGYADGGGTAAQFNYPYGIAVDNKGNILVADYNNHKIRKIITK